MIELLVSMTVLVTLTTVVVANYRRVEKQKKVSLAAEAIVGIIRSAQNATQTAQQISLSSCANKSAEYYLFTMTTTGSYALSAFNETCAQSHTLESNSLPARVAVSNLLLDDSPAASSLSIKFEAPFANIKGSLDNGSYGSFANSQIDLVLEDEFSKSVTIDGISGRISADD